MLLPITNIVEPHFTWVEGESLRELAKPERVAEIKSQHRNKCADAGRRLKDALLKDVLPKEEADDQGCVICHL